jgi:hypothetical protein
MREVKCLSPSAIGLYLEDPEKYYIRYLSEAKVEKDQQVPAMAIGSAFDAYAKAYLYKNLFGNADPKFEFQTLFETQVSPHLWDWALENGGYVFEQYKQSGCLTDLMTELSYAQGEPRFEFEVRGIVNSYREGVERKIGAVELLGKPDVDFVTRNGVHCILDFKVNGYCSNYSKSPSPYYIRMRSAGRTLLGQHPKCREVDHNGIKINNACCLNDIDEGWGRQLAIYGWLCGNPVGSDFVTIIHQIVCSRNRSGGLPGIRIAEHLNLIDPTFQHDLYNKACNIWEIVHSDWFFRDLTKEESIARCKMIDELLLETEDDLPVRAR